MQILRTLDVSAAEMLLEKAPQATSRWNGTRWIRWTAAPNSRHKVAVDRGSPFKACVDTACTQGRRDGQDVTCRDICSWPYTSCSQEQWGENQGLVSPSTDSCFPEPRVVIDQPLVIPTGCKGAWSFPTHLDIAYYQGVVWLVDCQVRFVQLPVLMVYIRFDLCRPSLLPRMLGHFGD